MLKSRYNTYRNQKSSANNLSTQVLKRDKSGSYRVKNKNKSHFLSALGLLRRKDYLHSKLRPCRVVIVGCKCSICGRSFKCSSDLTMHVTKHHFKINYDDDGTVQNSKIKDNYKLKHRMKLIIKIKDQIMLETEVDKRMIQRTKCKSNRRTKHQYIRNTRSKHDVNIQTDDFSIETIMSLINEKQKLEIFNNSMTNRLNFAMSLIQNNGNESHSHSSLISQDADSTLMIQSDTEEDVKVELDNAEKNIKLEDTKDIIDRTKDEDVEIGPTNLEYPEQVTSTMITEPVTMSRNFESGKRPHSPEVKILSAKNNMGKSVTNEESSTTRTRVFIRILKSRTVNNVRDHLTGSNSWSMKMNSKSVLNNFNDRNDEKNSNVMNGFEKQYNASEISGRYQQLRKGKNDCGIDNGNNLNDEILTYSSTGSNKRFQKEEDEEGRDKDLDCFIDPVSVNTVVTSESLFTIPKSESLVCEHCMESKNCVLDSCPAAILKLQGDYLFGNDPDSSEGFGQGTNNVTDNCCAEVNRNRITAIIKEEIDLTE